MINASKIKQIIVEVANNIKSDDKDINRKANELINNAIDNESFPVTCKVLREFESNEEMDIEYAWVDNENSISNITTIELDRNMIRNMEAASNINEDTNILSVSLIDPMLKKIFS